MQGNTIHTRHVITAVKKYIGMAVFHCLWLKKALFQIINHSFIYDKNCSCDDEVNNILGNEIVSTDENVLILYMHGSLQWLYLR